MRESERELKRSRIEIKIDLLTLIKEDKQPIYRIGKQAKGQKITWLKSNVGVYDHEWMIKTLGEFIRKGWVTHNSKRYSITEKGLKILKQWEILKKELMD